MYASLAKKQQEKIEAEQLKTLDEQTWNSIKDKANIQLFRDYMKDFANGMYTSDAKKQIKKLEDLLVTKQEEEQWQAIKDKMEAKLFADYLIAFPKGKYAEQAQVLLAKYTTMVSNTVANIKTIRDCTDCPEMAVVPKGSFLMGDKPQHLVTINKPLAVAKYELTIAEYNRCVKENACYKPPKSFNQNDQYPVSGLRWQDAKNYINWLSNKAKRLYRLPTEAEWEYFARAGTKTEWSFGNNPVDICQYANTADESYNRVFSSGDNYCNDMQANHASVGSYKPNAFGLYDTIGNVYEWVEDCFVDSYAAAPTDGSAVLSNNCDKRVVRGGAYAVSAHKATAASRLAVDPNDAFYLNGVRLVRDVKDGEY
jgi:formylglycine-generating enzyme required for sulfatase activity